MLDSTGNGSTLKYGGSDVTAGVFGAWSPIGAEKTANGYEVAWKFGTADQYTVWDTDANGNWTSSPIGVVAGSSPELEALEPSFQQDLNGDGTVGLPMASNPGERRCPPKPVFGLRPHSDERRRRQRHWAGRPCRRLWAC